MDWFEICIVVLILENIMMISICLGGVLILNKKKKTNTYIQNITHKISIIKYQHPNKPTKTY